MAFLPNLLYSKYIELQEPIKQRLERFASASEQQNFYELCYCLCTPQSKAKSAYIVQIKLEQQDFFYKDFDPVDILRDPEHYIRFHNEKAKRLISAKSFYPKILEILESEYSVYEKRDWIAENFKGLGMKESSHFLRNIGYKGLAILDRHILKHLELCAVIDEIPRTISSKKYKEIEILFLDFAEGQSIPIDELDLLFWSYETGEILK